MKLTKFGHSCLGVQDGQASLLIDPGQFSKGYEAIKQLDAILITHADMDHLDIEAVQQLVKTHAGVRVIVDASATKALDEAGITHEVVKGGDKLEVAGTTIEIVGQQHEPLYDALPAKSNVGFLIANRFFTPGDAWTVPDKPVEILAFPVAGPWMKVGDAINYVLSVKPKIAIPIHEAHSYQPLHYGMSERFMSQAGIKFQNIDDRKDLEV
jgi:L-ascorbate metabolism protein UlaG (beta-lactamase superfamily)